MTPKKRTGVFDDYLPKEEQGQIFGRVPKELEKKFKKIADDEGFSYYAAVEIAAKLFIELYEKRKGK